VEALSPRALERRLKRHVYGQPQQFLVVCAPGFEEVLAREVRALPEVHMTGTIRGGVEFEGPPEAMYGANLWLRCAHRVLWRIEEFLAQSYPMLFNKARKLPWERFVGFAGAVSFEVSARASRLHHQERVAETLYSAMLSALEPLGLRPGRSEDAPVKLHVRMFRDRCTLSVNTSGEHLHRRGYRTFVGEAPLRETLAAGLLMHLEAEQYDLIVDPMCGSGTLLIEAALLARKHPPGGARRFAFEHLPVFQESKWARLKREASEAGDHSFVPRLLGFDLDAKILEAARANTQCAGAQDILFRRGDARTLPYAELKEGYLRALLVSNPPYGKRLGGEEARTLYRALAEKLSPAPGWTVGLLTPNPRWLEGFGFTPQLHFQNGGLETYLMVRPDAYAKRPA